MPAPRIKSAEFVEHRLCLFKVLCVEAFGEPVVDRSEETAGSRAMGLAGRGAASAGPEQRSAFRRFERSIRRHWMPSRASSCAMTNPVGPAPTISAFGLSRMAPSTSSQWRKCRLVAKVPVLAFLREVLDPLLPP